MPRADRFGTISEQVRHSHSWRSPSQANDAWIKTRCKDCAEYFLIHDRGRHYCGRMGCVSAMPMGAHAGANIAARISAGRLAPFCFGFFIRCVSLGRRDGLVQFVDAQDRPTERVLTGRAAALVKELICRMTLESVRGELRTGLPLVYWPHGGRWWAAPAAA